MDDVLGISVHAGMAAELNKATYADAAVAVFNENCISNEKAAEVGSAGLVHRCWGYDWDLKDLREHGLKGGRIHVSESKLRSLVAIFEGVGYARLGEGVVASATHKSAAGSLVWCSRPSYILRVLLSLFGVMNPFAKGEFLRPEGDVTWVRSLWMTYIGAIGILRTALPNIILATGKLDCPLLGALDPAEQALDGPVTGVGSDASLQPKEDSNGAPILSERGIVELEGGCGFACHTTHTWASCSINEFLPELRQVFGEDVKIAIFFCELLMIVAGALEVGPAWAGRLITVPIDNSNAYYALRKFRSTHTICQFGLGILARLMLQFDFNILPFWVSTEDHRLYDDLSRFYDKDHAFLEELVATHVAGYTRIDLSAGFRSLLSGGTSHPNCLTCRLPSDKAGSPGQLWYDWLTKHFPDRHAGAGPAHASTCTDGQQFQRVGVVELGQGCGKLLTAAQKAGATPVALIGPPGKLSGVAAGVLGQAALRQTAPWSAGALNPEKVQLVLVAPALHAWTAAGAEFERALYNVHLPSVVTHLRPEVVVVVRDVGASEVRIAEVDQTMQALGYTRVCSELGYGAAVGGGVDKAYNLELKGGSHRSGTSFTTNCRRWQSSDRLQGGLEESEVAPGRAAASRRTPSSRLGRCGHVRSGPTPQPAARRPDWPPRADWTGTAAYPS